MLKKITPFIISLLFLACQNNPGEQDEIQDNHPLTDPDATTETKVLYENLKKISKTHLLYGHQDDLNYGVGWWNEDGRSDVKEVCGSYPAVFGWELGNLGNERNLDSVLFTDIQKNILKAWELGAVNTISWHMENPVNHKNSWDQTKAVPSILPGAEKHEYYKERLRAFALFNDGLKDKNNIPIPIIFRPFHEHNGSWFWWGKDHCTKQEYIALWKFTIEFLCDSLNIHNLLYAYSPDGQFDDYADRYPGDDQVDILGVDYYFREKVDDRQINHFVTTLKELTKLSRQKNKPAILSETGFESIPDPLWHTKAILNPIKKNRDKIEIAFMLTWRNANTKHHYAPYPGHHSEEDFKAFYKDPYTMFADSLKDFNIHRK